MSDNRDFIYTIPQTVLLDLDLHLVDLRVYAIVRSFMDTTGDAYPSNGWLAKKLGVEPRTIQASLVKLIEKRYMTRSFVGGRRYLFVGKSIPESIVSQQGGDVQIMGGCSTDHGGGDVQITQLYQSNIVSKKIENNEPPAVFSDLPVDNSKEVAANDANVQLDEIFESLWQVYPLKKAKQNAKVAFKKIFNTKTGGERERLMKSFTRGFVAHVAEHKAKHELKNQGADLWIPALPHLVTWINQGRWEDDYQLPEDILRGASRKKTLGVDLAAREQRLRQEGFIT